MNSEGIGDAIVNWMRTAELDDDKYRLLGVTAHSDRYTVTYAATLPTTRATEFDKAAYHFVTQDYNTGTPALVALALANDNINNRSRPKDERDRAYTRWALVADIDGKLLNVGYTYPSCTASIEPPPANVIGPNYRAWPLRVRELVDCAQSADVLLYHPAAPPIPAGTCV